MISTQGEKKISRKTKKKLLKKKGKKKSGRRGERREEDRDKNLVVYGIFSTITVASSMIRFRQKRWMESCFIMVYKLRNLQISVFALFCLFV